MSLAGAEGTRQRRSCDQAHQTASIPPSPEPQAKRRCGWTDPNDAAVAELLLGLSHSSRSSPRDSNVSEEDIIHLSPRVSHEIASKPAPPLSKRRSRRVGRQPIKFARADSEDEEEGAEESLSEDSSSKDFSRQQPATKELPVRCKCGKRVSASHPPCKSELMLLSERFRDKFAHSCGEGEDSKIDLNDCALALGVPRRRLYDITIVYEAAEVVRRTGKLAYVWQGLDHLPQLISRLKHEEETGQPVGDRRGNPHGAALDQQNTHSLWTLSRKFIRLLLTRQGVVQLSDAAVHLIGDRQGTRPQTYLTVERRLYDIGSILSTLDLIKRTYIEGKRQPAFSWNWDRIDPKVEHMTSPRLASIVDQGQHSGPTPITSVFESPEASQQLEAEALAGASRELDWLSLRNNLAAYGGLSLPMSLAVDCNQQTQLPLQWPALMQLTGVNPNAPDHIPSLAQTAFLNYLHQWSSTGNKSLPSAAPFSEPSPVSD